jgi:dolichol-phosphate mannosyltransferase
MRTLALPATMLQFVRFAIVGASGYALNLGVFALAHRSMDYRLAAGVAFLAAVANNFLWNRAWTFRDARGGHAGFQAARFLAISLAAFVFGLALLDVLVRDAGMTPVLAQAISIVMATPLSFVGNKLWSFREPA